MEAARCSETAISYEVTRHGAKDNLYIYRLENLSSLVRNATGLS